MKPAYKRRNFAPLVELVVILWRLHFHTREEALEILWELDRW